MPPIHDLQNNGRVSYELFRKILECDKYIDMGCAWLETTHTEQIVPHIFRLIRRPTPLVDHIRCRGMKLRKRCQMKIPMPKSKSLCVRLYQQIPVPILVPPTSIQQRKQIYAGVSDAKPVQYKLNAHSAHLLSKTLSWCLLLFLNLRNRTFVLQTCSQICFRLLHGVAPA